MAWPRLRATLAGSLLALAAPVTGQAAHAPAQTATENAPATTCELHVWPGNDLRSTYHGWFHGGIVDGAVQGRQGYRKLPVTPLSTAAQSETLKQLQLPELLGLAGYRQVLHEAPLDSRTLRATAGRIFPSSSPCYAELAVDDVFFQEDIVDGRFVKVMFRFRQFREGESPTRQFGTYIQETLLLFPPKEPDEDPRLALDELSDAFGKAVDAFGQALNKPIKPRRNK